MAMDFFEHQDAARRKTGRLVALFILAVLSIVVVVYVAAAVLYLNVQPEQVEPKPVDYRELWNPQLFLVVAGATLAVIGLGSLLKTFELWSGGESVALLLGGRLVVNDTASLAEKRLLNVVEEMALASGTSVPRVYVLDREPNINAFAAGFTPGDAVIGVTRGTLELLDRDQLQGVVAHEFSHILNGDMRLNLRLMGLLHGLLLISLLGYFLMRNAFVAGGDDRKKGGGAAILAFGTVLYVAGYLGVFFGRLIKAAVSREREYLADASAVQFTRNPEGIAGALKKIGGSSQEARIRDSHAEEASHLFFGNALFNAFNLLSTHPPLAERIRRIDPSFDGKFPHVRVDLSDELAAEGMAALAARTAEIEAESIPAEIQLLRARANARRAIPADAADRVGRPSTETLRYARGLLVTMPPELAQAAREPYGARALMFALLLDPDARVRREELARLEPQTEEQVYRETCRLAPVIDAAGDAYWLPLVDLALPALKSLSPRQYADFRHSVELLIKSDSQVDLFEYVLWIVLVRHLDEHFSNRRPRGVHYYGLSGIGESAALVFGMLAYAGHREEDKIGQAFLAGIQTLGLDAKLPERGQCTLGALDAALEQLVQASAPVKRRLIEACAACVAADGEATVREAELLRAVCAMLDCPMPPLLPADRGAS
jgi:Zn-dependent protease with chaperone function